MVKIMALGNGMNVCYGGRPTEEEMKEFVIALSTVQDWCDKQLEEMLLQLPPQMRNIKNNLKDRIKLCKNWHKKLITKFHDKFKN